MKVCFRCGQEKPVSEFYGHPRMKDGHLGKCKECTKVDVTVHRALNLERIHAYDRQRSKDPERKRAKLAYEKRYRKELPSRQRAHNAAVRALRAGKLTRKPCEVCGKRAEMHHDDYVKPLEVRWLCALHHHAAHRKHDYEALLRDHPMTGHTTQTPQDRPHRSQAGPS